MHEPDSRGILRMKCTVRGAVQGVGFRPFVFNLASRLHLHGWVSNSSHGVAIEVEGEKVALDNFLLSLEKEKPPHSFIQSLEAVWLDMKGYGRFDIRESKSDGDNDVIVQADIATCPDCLAEMVDPTNRRYLYPFTNCTHCGPRYTIIESLPYDRCNTTMSGFTMCEACRREYENPANRRFHAQPNACPSCGPQWELWNEAGTVLASGHDAMMDAAERIRSGYIVAVKGLGGFHLIVDARNEQAVAQLRTRKHREAKPLAVMFPSIDAIKKECEVCELEERLLQSAESPIVLLKRKLAIEHWSLNVDDCPAGERSMSNGQRSIVNEMIAPSVAPDNPYLGAMVPYTPLHHILMKELGVPVVATSGNLSDEPICTDEHEALKRLKGIADVFLVHNRRIVRHVDDSVARVMLGREQVLRRARGYAPLPIAMNDADGATILAVGAHQKNAVALARGENIFVSQHIGDLDTKESLDAFRNVVASLQDLCCAHPETIVSDMHPDYASTQFAKHNFPNVVHIQHHAAHVASCMAENELDGQVLGIAWDGTGYGLDGKIWGGEFLLATPSSCKRVATIREFSLPGSAQSVKEPRRTALGVLYEIFGDAIFELDALAPVAAFTGSERTVLRRMLSNGINSPRTTSIGRLFDAVASIVNLRHIVSFEGQAAMELEFALRAGPDVGLYEYFIEPATNGNGFGWVVDWAPFIANIVHDVLMDEHVSVISQRFHNTLAEIVVDVAGRVGEQRVVLTGGCFQNRYLSEHTVKRLEQEGFRPYWHQRVPPNDGGIAVGQVFAALHLMQTQKDNAEGTASVQAEQEIEFVE